MKHCHVNSLPSPAPLPPPHPTQLLKILLFHFHSTHCQLSGHTKICQFGVALQVQEDVASLYVSVDFSLKVKILQPLQSIL